MLSPESGKFHSPEFKFYKERIIERALNGALEYLRQPSLEYSRKDNSKNEIINTAQRICDEKWFSSIRERLSKAIDPVAEEKKIAAGLKIKIIDIINTKRQEKKVA